MDALEQRLKELNSKEFESLCFHVLKEKYPNGTVSHVDGSGGDEGLDVYAGELSGTPTIWQCKSFPNGIGKSQKAQIKKSLSIALKHFTPANWILCLSIDMDVKANRWFEKLRKSNESRVKIGLFAASDILHELIYRRAIRNHYFPGAAIDPVELRRIISRSEELTEQELEKLNEDNLEDFVERLMERDARCSYQIVFDSDMGPSAPRHPVTDDLLLSMSTGAKTINVFARDREALHLNPPRFQLSLTETGINKYRELIRTGNQQEFLRGDFVSFTTDWPVLAPAMQHLQGPKARLIVGPPERLTNRERGVRITFRKNGESVEYGLMKLRPIRVGTEEAECVCSAENLPFDISIVLPSPFGKSGDYAPIDNGRIRFRSRIVGSKAKQAKKFLDAMSMFQPTGEIEIFDLREEVIFLSAKVELDEDSPEQHAYRRFVNDVAQIADRFKVDLRIPSKLTDEDLVSILVLKSFAEGSSIEVENISATIVKSEDNKDLLPQALASGRGFFRFAHPNHEPKFRLFGLDVDTGPYLIEAECEINGLPTVLEEFQRASIGDGVAISFKILNRPRFALLTAQQWQEAIGGSHASISKKNG
ncbi:MAG: hypothetical protein ACLP1Y_09555 [Candidatus Acidiferrales bacterium]